MPDSLDLRTEFPAVSTADWEAVIQEDLQGADYDKKLVWRPEEGITVRPYYRRDVLETLGDFPFTRGAAQNAIPPAGVIRGDYLHEAGATTVQELAFSLAQAVEAFAAFLETNTTANTEMVFVYAIGSNYFFEIAKLRAARLLWSSAVAAFGVEHQNAPHARIEARTARLNKSLCDPYNNLLRVTTEAAAALIGGCDALTAGAFGFAPHLAANVEHILREEAYLTTVFDPAGGSYYLEALTDSLAKASWRLFQSVEAAGGWSAARESGWVEQQLTQSAEAKAAAVSSRSRTLVGVNNYPNVAEKTCGAQAPPPLPDDPFPQSRLAEPFEALRRRTAAHARKTGRYPQILLLTRGDPKMRAARAAFCFNLFGCAGFDLIESEHYRGAHPDLIILCSSDAEYLALAREVCPSSAVPVLVAGNPKDQLAELQAVGVQGFVHAGSNALETLTQWQDKLGMRP